MTYLAVPITISDPADLPADLDAAVAQGATCLELRLDYLADPSPAACHAMIAQAKATRLPVIATLRSADEGGRFLAPDTARQTLLDAILAAQPDYLDLEFASFLALPPDRRHTLAAAPTRLILSHHDFNACPPDLPGRLEQMDISPAADVCKTAYAAQSITDAFAALDALHAPNAHPLIALAMGEPGLITRLAAPKFAAWATFATLDPDAASAPGQLTLAQMKQYFRFDAITPETRLFGVIGCPVAHSLSPLMHNAAFSATGGGGYDGLYLPLRVEPDYAHLTAFLDAVRKRPWLDFRGMSVTIPHKANVLQYLQDHNQRVEPLAETIGAVNTLLFEPDGSLFGCNTDYVGAMTAITDHLKIKTSDLANLHAAVIGAGGVARAVVAGLTHAGARVTIYNRALSRARELADRFHAAAAPLDELPRHCADLLVNCTSLGMTPNVDASPAPPDALRPGLAVFDTVYTPLQTRLLQDAHAAGCTTIDGAAMFVAQAAAQYRLWTLHDPPLDLMRTTVLKHLTP